MGIQTKTTKTNTSNYVKSNHEKTQHWNTEHIKSEDIHLFQKEAFSHCWHCNILRQMYLIKLFFLILLYSFIDSFQNYKNITNAPFVMKNLGLKNDTTKPQQS